MAASLLHIALLLSSFPLSATCFHLPTATDLTNDARLDWSSAEQHCLSTYNQHLLSIHSASELNSVRDAVHALGPSIPTHSFWIGLVSSVSDFSLQWTDASPFDFGSDLSGGVFPWFDERPEQLSAAGVGVGTRYVRLWGGGADLLWDDTDGANAHFWVCDGDNNATATEETTIDVAPSPTLLEEDVDEAVTYNDNANANVGDDELVGEFWKFALIVLIVISSCILLLRVRSTWKFTICFCFYNMFHRVLTFLTFFESVLSVLGAAMRRNAVSWRWRSR